MHVVPRWPTFLTTEPLSSLRFSWQSGVSVLPPQNPSSPRVLHCVTFGWEKGSLSKWNSFFCEQQGSESFIWFILEVWEKYVWFLLNLQQLHQYFITKVTFTFCRREKESLELSSSSVWGKTGFHLRMCRTCCCEWLVYENGKLVSNSAHNDTL